MKREKVDKIEEWEIRIEYDFSNARPNKYAEKYAEATNLVLSEPDLINFFPAKESDKR
jgi:hypothetical protein